MILTKQDCVKRIAEIVAKYYDISVSDIYGLRRVRELSEPRYMAIFLAYRLTENITLSQVGEVFNRDHSTVSYCLRSMVGLLEVDSLIRHKYERLTKKINNNQEIYGFLNPKKRKAY